MIPFPIAALKELTVLVTRPAAQASPLCARIKAMGGEAIAFPTIVIEPTAAAQVTQNYDWLIFTSVNAVRFGLPLITRSETTRIAAIGKATAGALAACDVRVDAMPAGKAQSETLLTHPAFANVQTQSVLLVKGEGGRELLHDDLTQRGARVASLDVYRRAQPHIDASAVAQLEQRWREEIDIVTLTSAETLGNLLALLSATGQALLKVTPFVAPSMRVVDAARSAGLAGIGVLSRGADDEALVGAIAAWHARAR